MIRPVNKRLIAKLAPEQEIKKGALLLASAPNKRDTFEIVAISENEQGLKVGDIILVVPYGVQEMQIEGETFYMAHNDEVIGVFEYAKT